MSLGVIPELDTPSYAELRDRKEAGWYQETMREALSGKLCETNEMYGLRKKLKTNIAGIYDKVAYQMYLLLLGFVNKKKGRKNIED